MVWLLGFWAPGLRNFVGYLTHGGDGDCSLLFSFEHNLSWKSGREIKIRMTFRIRPNLFVVGVSGGRECSSAQVPDWSRNCHWPLCKIGEAGPKKESTKAVSCCLVSREGQCWRKRTRERVGVRCRVKKRGLGEGVGCC